MTNPPVPATPLDVEACVREAAEAIEGLFVPAHRSGCLWLNDHRMPCQCGSAERERAAVLRARRAAEALRHALASALPGMGKACDLLREAAEFTDHAGACRMNNYYPGDTCTCGYDEWRERAARAAQPEETSADASQDCYACGHARVQHLNESNELDDCLDCHCSEFMQSPASSPSPERPE